VVTPNAIDGIKAYIIPGVTFILGLLVRHLFSLWRNRIARLDYSINRVFLGASGQDQLFGRVEVHYNGTQVANLYMFTLQMQNSSNTDFTDLKMNIWCNLGSLILVSNGRKLSSVEPLQFTAEYAAALQAVGENQNIDQVFTRRVYSVPVLNRDEQVEFSCLVTNRQGTEPSLYLECDKPGLRLAPRFVKPELWWGERRDLSALVGLLVTGLMLVPAVQLIHVGALLAIVAFVLGGFCMFPGAVVLKLVRLTRRLVR